MILYSTIHKNWITSNQNHRSLKARYIIMCGKQVTQEKTATMNGSSRQTPYRLTVVPFDMASSITTANNSKHENRRLVLRIIDDVLDIISDDLLGALEDSRRGGS
jgi:hypothetical protein